jgi:hypothetical protein
MNNFFTGQQEPADGTVVFIKEGNDWKIQQEIWRP